MTDATEGRFVMVRKVRRFTRSTAVVSAAALAALSVGAAAGAAVASTDDAPATSPNPGFSAQCGLDLGIVLDGSGSIGSAEGQVRAAARALLEPLRDTSTNAGIVTFSRAMKSSATVSLRPLTSESYAGIFTTQIDNYRFGGTTNWDLALRTAANNFVGTDGDRPGVPNLLVFVTDGAPNTVGGTTKTIGASGYTSTDGTTTGLGDAAAAAVNPAIQAANDIKASGTRMLTIGVGKALTSGSRNEFIEALRKVTAPVKADVVADAGVIPNSISGNYDVQSAYDASTTDLILVRDFSQLSAELANVASTLCSGSLTINKLASTPDAPDSYEPASGWDFTATPSAQNSSYNWVLPNASSGDTAQTGTTDSSGKTTFQWDVLGSAGRTDWNANKGIAVSEATKKGFVLSSVTCKDADGADVAVSGLDPATGAFTVPVGVLDIVTCDVKNRAKAPVTVTVGKVASGDTFYDDGTSTTFPLVVSGPAVPGSPKTLGTKAGSSKSVTLEPFSGATTPVTVSEGTAPAGWSLSSITCTVNDRTVQDADGETAGFQLALAPGDDVSCSVTNTVTAPEATVKVTKSWVIDGTAYTNDALPEGFGPASLTLTGEGAPEAPLFGVTYSGFQAARTVTIGESTGALPAGCVSTPSGDLGSKTLEAGANTFAITNTVSCPATVTVGKVWVVDGTTYPTNVVPDGFAASATVEDEAAVWGTAVTGFHRGQSVAVGETGVTVPDNCEIVGEASVEGPAALAPGSNVFTITNTARCTDPGEPTPTPTPTETGTGTPTPTETGGGSLPQTGGSGGALLGWGLLLLVGGLLMTVVARRRDNGARHVG